MSNLMKHAECEMRKAGLYDADSDYGGMIPEAVLALVKAHSEQGHSCGSHHVVLQIFNRVVNFKTLTPISSDPSEWFKHDYQTAGSDCWQNTRQPSVFSQDGGKTWYDLDDPEKKNWPKRDRD
jgi:D-serine dehydratase